MKNVMDILRERGFVKQTVFKDELYRLLGEKSVILCQASGRWCDLPDVIFA